PDHGQRRLGARLLPALPEPASGVPEGVVGCRQLGGDQQAPRAGRLTDPPPFRRDRPGALASGPRGTGAAPLRWRPPPCVDAASPPTILTLSTPDNPAIRTSDGHDGTRDAGRSYGRVPCGHRDRRPCRGRGPLVRPGPRAGREATAGPRSPRHLEVDPGPCDLR